MKNVGRRRFLKAVPAAVAASVSLPALARAQRGGGAPPKFGKDALKCAEQIDGLHFTDAEEEMAAAGASRNLDSYEELRKLNIPLDTEPAMTFRPYRGQTLGGQTRTSGLQDWLSHLPEPESSDQKQFGTSKS